MDNGHLTWIDSGHDHWEVLVGTDDTFHPGSSSPWKSTYCRRVLERGGLIVIHDVRAEERGARTHAFDSYFGASIRIGELIGTVCFVAEHGRAAFTRPRRSSTSSSPGC